MLFGVRAAQLLEVADTYEGWAEGMILQSDAMLSLGDMAMLLLQLPRQAFPSLQAGEKRVAVDRWPGA